jgi:hypothetical protein
VTQPRGGDREDDAIVRSILLTVVRLPPSKSEAKLMLALGHVHGDRVPALLRAAEAALDEPRVMFTDRSLGIDPVLTSRIRRLRMRRTTSAASRMSSRSRIAEVRWRIWVRWPVSGCTRTTGSCTTSLPLGPRLDTGYPVCVWER